MISVSKFNPKLKKFLPETYEVLANANLMVDPRVYKIILYGSRGLKGGCKETSDVDLILLFDDSGLDDDYEREITLKSSLEETLEEWHSNVSPDLAGVFDNHGCRLPCLSNSRIDVRKCPHRGINCFGLFRCTKGFESYLASAGTRVDALRPCLTIWEK